MAGTGKNPHLLYFFFYSGRQIVFVDMNDFVTTVFIRCVGTKDDTVACVSAQKMIQLSMCWHKRRYSCRYVGTKDDIVVDVLAQKTIQLSMYRHKRRYSCRCVGTKDDTVVDVLAQKMIQLSMCRHKRRYSCDAELVT